MPCDCCKEKVKTFLDMASTFIGHAYRTSDDRARDNFGSIAQVYYDAAVIAADHPPFSDEWPGYAVWSARKLMELDADDAMLCEQVGAGT